MYEHITSESIQSAILAQVSAFDIQEGSFARTLIAPAAYEMWKVYTALEGVPSMLFPDENSGVYIDKKCADYGLSRKPGTAASAAVEFSGPAGLVVPAGKVFLTAVGLRYLLAEAVTLDKTGSGVGTLTAESVGSAYNTDTSEIAVQQVNLPGLDFTAGAASGGVDEESDASLCQRLYEHLRRPATSGNVNEYLAWAKSVPGVGEARVFPLWDGPGTVKVVVCSEDKKPVDSTVTSACAAYIESVRPIGAAVTVASAAAKAVTVSAAVQMDNSTTIGAVKEAFQAALEDYLQSIAFKKSVVVYARLGFLLLDIDGVQGYQNLTLNGSPGNLALADDEVPVLSEVTLSETS